MDTASGGIAFPPVGVAVVPCPTLATCPSAGSTTRTVSLRPLARQSRVSPRRVEGGGKKRRVGVARTATHCYTAEAWSASGLFPQTVPRSLGAVNRHVPSTWGRRLL